MADAYIEKGTTYEIDGKVYECLEFLHVKPVKGSAFVRTDKTERCYQRWCC